MKVLDYFYLKSLIFFNRKSWKTGTENTLLSQSRASLGFSRNSLSNRFGERSAPMLKQELNHCTAKLGWLCERGADPATHEPCEPDSEPKGYWVRVLLAVHCSGAIHWAEQRGVLLRSPWWSASILPIVQRSTNRADSLCESLYLVQYFIVRLYVKGLP